MNEMIMWLVILCLFLALGAIIILVVDTIVLRKTDSKLNKFNEWYEEQEKNKEIKKLKALEIIKAKEVNFAYFIIYINKKENYYERYKDDFLHGFNSTAELLTQEEYELLKEVFYNEL